MFAKLTLAAAAVAFITPVSAAPLTLQPNVAEEGLVQQVSDDDDYRWRRRRYDYDDHRWRHRDYGHHRHWQRYHHHRRHHHHHHHRHRQW